MVEAGAYDASNFNQLLSYLGNMTPQQRVQVGQMHQNDFEVITALSLINSAEARAKQALMTQQAMGQQAAPPVNQQVIAEAAQNALPEEVGIGALPAPNMERMAGGGITGEDDVESYAPGGTTGVDAEFRAFLKQLGVTTEEFIQANPKAREAIKDMFESQRTSATPAAPSAAPSAAAASKGTAYELGKKFGPALSKTAGAVGRNIVPGAGAAYTIYDLAQDAEKTSGFYNDPNVPLSEKAAQAARTGAKAFLPAAGGVVGSFFAPVAGTIGGASVGAGLSSLIDTEGQALREYRMRKAAEQQRFDQAKAQAQAGEPTVEQQAAASQAAAAASAGQRPPAAGGAAPSRPAIAATPTAPAARTPEDFARMYERASSAITAEDPASAERKMLQSEITEAARARQEAFDKEVAARGDRYKGREERLTKREAALGKEATTNEGLALLSAAAAVLQPGGLAAGLMKAANVAIPQYQAGLDKLKAAQDRIEEGRDRLDELRQNYDDLTNRERRQLADDVNKSAIEARKLGIDGIMAAQGVKEKKAASVYDAMVKQEIEQMQQSGAMARTITSGEYGVKAAQARNAGMGDFKLAQLAETTRKNIVSEAQKLYKYDPAMQQQYIQAAMRQAIQQNPGLAEYMGVTGGGAAPSQSDPLGILGTKP